MSPASRPGPALPFAQAFAKAYAVVPVLILVIVFAAIALGAAPAHAQNLEGIDGPSDTSTNKPYCSQLGDNPNDVPCKEDPAGMNNDSDGDGQTEAPAPGQRNAAPETEGGTQTGPTDDQAEDQGENLEEMEAGGSCDVLGIDICGLAFKIFGGVLDKVWDWFVGMTETVAKAVMGVAFELPSMQDGEQSSLLDHYESAVDAVKPAIVVGVLILGLGMMLQSSSYSTQYAVLHGLPKLVLVGLGLAFFPELVRALTEATCDVGMAFMSQGDYGGAMGKLLADATAVFAGTTFFTGGNIGIAAILAGLTLLPLLVLMVIVLLIAIFKNMVFAMVVLMGPFAMVCWPIPGFSQITGVWFRALMACFLIPVLLSLEVTVATWVVDSPLMFAVGGEDQDSWVPMLSTLVTIVLLIVMLATPKKVLDWAFSGAMSGGFSFKNARRGISNFFSDALKTAGGAALGGSAGAALQSTAGKKGLMGELGRRTGNKLVDAASSVKTGNATRLGQTRAGGAMNRMNPVLAAENGGRRGRREEAMSPKDFAKNVLKDEPRNAKSEQPKIKDPNQQEAREMGQRAENARGKAAKDKAATAERAAVTDQAAEHSLANGSAADGQGAPLTNEERALQAGADSYEAHAPAEAADAPAGPPPEAFVPHDGAVPEPEALAGKAREALDSSQYSLSESQKDGSLLGEEHPAAPMLASVGQKAEGSGWLVNHAQANMDAASRADGAGDPATAASSLRAAAQSHTDLGAVHGNLAADYRNLAAATDGKLSAYFADAAGGHETAATDNAAAASLATARAGVLDNPAAGPAAEGSPDPAEAGVPAVAALATGPDWGAIRADGLQRAQTDADDASRGAYNQALADNGALADQRLGDAHALREEASTGGHDFKQRMLLNGEARRIEEEARGIRADGPSYAREQARHARRQALDHSIGHFAGGVAKTHAARASEGAVSAAQNHADAQLRAAQESFSYAQGALHDARQDLLSDPRAQQEKLQTLGKRVDELKDKVSGWKLGGNLRASHLRTARQEASRAAYDRAYQEISSRPPESRSPGYVAALPARTPNLRRRRKADETRSPSPNTTEETR